MLQVGCLGLIGMLTVVGCGGSETTPKKDGGPDSGDGGPAAARITVSPTGVSVGTVELGKTSSVAPVTVTNTGTVAGIITLTPTTGIAATGCTGSLGPNASCTVSITATPSALGAIVGSVGVGIANGNSVSVSVGGNCIPQGSSFTLDPATITLPDVLVGATAQVTVNVTATTAISDLTVGVLGAELKIDTTSSTCGTTLAAGATCKVVATFTAGAAGVPANLQILVTSGGFTKYVPVTVNVITPCRLQASPSSVALAATAGEQSQPAPIKIGNLGGSACAQAVVAVAPVGAPFKVLTEDCTITALVPGATCTVNVVYTPAATATAAENGTLSISGGAGSTPATVALTGTPNVEPTLSVTGTSNLGSAAPGQQGTEVLFTVTNTSTVPTGALDVKVSNPVVVVSSNTCLAKTTLNANETCTIGLRLAPPAGSPPATVSVLLTVTPANGKPFNLTVTGTIVTPPSLSALPTSVTFGSVPVGQTSTVQTVRVTNTGATATAALQVVPSGTGAAQVAVSANSCNVPLAPAASCTFGVQYAPTDTSGVSGTIVVSDGVVSVTIPMSGTGLTVAGFRVDPSNVNFGTVVLGYTQATPDTDPDVAGRQMLTVTAVSTDKPTGAITFEITGAAATDFAVATATSTCGPSLQPAQSCVLDLTFKPTAVGTRGADLKVTGANGGSWVVALTGVAVPLVELVPLDATSQVTGLDFGQQTNGTAKMPPLQYRMIVRGATDPAATSTTAQVSLVTGTTPDFRNVDWNEVNPPVATQSNRCNAGALAFDGGQATAADSGNWISDIIAATATSPQVATRVWYCDFYIQFNPQTGKSTTPKTATLNAASTAGGTASLALTGLATGPLTINPTAATFQTVVVLGGSSETNPVDDGTLVLNPNEEVVTFTVANQGASGTQGPLVVALAGTNAADFGIVSDGCAGSTLNPAGTCAIIVAFAPTSAGAKTATITVTGSGGETAVATVNATAGQPYAVTVAPATAEFPSVPQANIGEWRTFTISNPAGATLTGKLNYELAPAANDFQIFTLADGTAPDSWCGAGDTKQLAAGESCTVLVRFTPRNTINTATLREATLTVTVGGQPLTPIALSGRATPQLVLSGADVTVVEGAQTVNFGQVATGTPSAVKSITVSNAGAANAGGSVTLAFTPPPAYSVGPNSQCTNGAVLAGGEACRLDLIYTGVGVQATAQTVTMSIAKNGTATVATPIDLVAQSVAPAALALSGFGDYAAAPVEYIDMGAVPLNGNTGTLTLWFTNTGSVNATQFERTFTGTEFSVVPEGAGTCFSGAALAPGARCSVNVQFRPTSAGEKTSVFTLLAAGVPPVTVNLRARGITLANSVYAVVKGTSNSLHTFPGSAAVGSTTTKVYFLLQNNSGSAIDISDADLGPTITLGGGGRPTDFIVAKETDAGQVCGNSLANATSCTFSVTFSPDAWVSTATLHRWATILATVGEDDPVQIAAVIGQVRKPAKLQLSATSTPTVEITGTSPNFTADFGQILAQQSSSVTLTITNIGEQATAGAVGLTLNAAANTYATSTNTCGSEPLAAGASCTATVTVQAPLGTHDTGTVQANGAGDEDSAEIFTLDVEVVDAASLTLSTPGGRAFANTVAGATSAALVVNVLNGVALTDRQDSGPLTVTLSNATDFELVLGAGCIGAAGQPNDSLPGGTNCDISVVFTPQSAGAKSTIVSVSATPGTTTPQTVTLTGTALGALSISPTGTAAAPVALTLSSGEAVLTVTNDGADTTGLLQVSLAGANAASFSLVENTCYGQRLAAGVSCTVTVQVIGTPSTTTAWVGTVTVSDGTPNATATSYFKVGGPAT